ncbi:YXWGXW repeat-containing protein [Dyella sp. C9]|uniref:YXWGXW repeat-containing protein n=1 Tax=Dyella sp. C9 TaxID=2202154 RepID=UPI000DEF88E5|nr:YXWGXW repeat-containing protein [Dyella sp. C9]
MEKCLHDHRVAHRRLRSAALILAMAACAAVPLGAQAGVSIGVGISVGVPPPPLPIYVQPAIPAPGYIWVPGYWAWDGDGYYWVPGTWILPPFVGALWTPGWWGWSGGLYVFHAGYWGPHVGFYGGVNYGFGYTGVGYVGGYWRNGGFYYNRSVNHIDNVHITNVYNQTVNNVTVNRTSFNGGQGGLTARPTPQEAAFAREQHVAPVAAQVQQGNLAARDPSMRASFNHGAPAVAATPRAGSFSGQGVAASRGSIGQASPAAATVQHAATPVQQAPRNNDMALRSAGFAPHAAGTGTPQATAAAATHAGNGNYAASGSRATYASHNAAPHANYPSSYHPQQAYHAQAYHAPVARPAPQHAPASHGAPSHEEHH